MEPTKPNNDQAAQNPAGDQPNRAQNQNQNQQGGNRPPRRPAGDTTRFRKPGAGTNDPNRAASQGVPGPRMAQPKPQQQQQQRSGGGGGGGAASRGRRRMQQQMPSHTDLVPALDAMPVNKSSFNGLSGAQQSRKAAQQAAQNQDRGAANQTSREPKLRVIPLGGLGEVGKNMTAFEFGNDIIVVDMGFKFPTAEQPGIDYIIPDTSWLLKNKHKVRGHIITHGHEDHIGGVPFILPRFPAPLYGARFTLARIEHKLIEYKLQTQPQYRVINPDNHERVQVGAFNIELVRVTHSIPDATAVVIRTPAGTVVHTGDWRLDPDPVDGKRMDVDRLRAIGDEGVMLLMSDSTNCERPGRTPSEKEISPNFDKLFTRAEGRVIISSFSTQINRMQLIVDAAQRAGRKLAFVGRSMLANVEIAVKMGYLKVPAGMIIRVQEIINLPDGQVVILCTGSQGEENSALSRMATGDHQNVKIKPGDTVVFSASPIPGNEVAIVRSVDNLMREGARVYQHITRDIDDHGILHVSGHAAREDIIDMLAMVRPKYFMPIHGEFHHLVRHAELAVKHGGIVPANVFVMDNGDVLELTPSKAVKGARVPAGMIMIDGAGVGDVEGIVLRDRLAMSGDGVFMIIATVSRKTGKLISSPDIISRGFIYMKENEELINKARAEVRKVFEKRNVKEPADWAKFKLRLRDEVGDMLYAKTKRNPMILPVINEV
ncbi:MAG: Ribocuclease [Patescibacteria group bacterium]|nr:Ribocuclease [Patescibacteria group bacterium]